MRKQHLQNGSKKRKYPASSNSRVENTSLMSGVRGQRGWRAQRGRIAFANI